MKRKIEKYAKKVRTRGGFDIRVTFSIRGDGADKG